MKQAIAGIIGNTQVGGVYCVSWERQLKHGGEMICGSSQLGGWKTEFGCFLSPCAC